MNLKEFISGLNPANREFRRFKTPEELKDLSSVLINIGKNLSILGLSLLGLTVGIILLYLAYLLFRAAR